MNNIGQFSSFSVSLTVCGGETVDQLPVIFEYYYFDPTPTFKVINLGAGVILKTSHVYCPLLLWDMVSLDPFLVPQPYAGVPEITYDTSI
jgi:hypothetical protein